MKTRLFISKRLSELDLLPAFLLQQGIDLEAHSFLNFEPRTFNLPYEFDVIFFGSPRAVFFFLEQEAIPKGVSIAAVGESTANKLKAQGYEVNFVGSGEITSVANEFYHWCGGRKVFFPLSSRSLKTVSSVFSSDQKHEEVVYESQVTEKKINPADIYIFTSPSNLEGFLKLNDFPSKAKIIAWGESTAKAMETNGILPDIVLDLPTEESLIEALNKE